MDGYRAGLNGPELDFAVTKYNGHRMIPREHLDVIKAKFKKKQEDKLKATFNPLSLFHPPPRVCVKKALQSVCTGNFF